MPRSLLLCRLLMLVLVLAALARPRAGTLATFKTSVGTMELELFDEDKPATVSNFIKYATSGRFTNQFIQRWEPNFVIQGGGYAVTNNTTGGSIVSVPVFQEITNEYSVGHTFSNTYGTIAMARRGGGTNSATSQWFLNLTNNAFLDKVDGGFTVFGRLLEGTNVLNLFIPPPPTNGIFLVNAGGALSTLPALSPSPQIADLIFVELQLRRDLHLAVSPTRPGQRRISFDTVAGVTNILEYASVTNLSAWVLQTNLVGTGRIFSIDADNGPGKIYRVKLFY